MSGEVKLAEGLREELLDLLELGGDYAADVFNGFPDRSSPCAKRVEANLKRFNKALAAIEATRPPVVTGQDGEGGEEVLANVARIIHGAMVYAVNHFKGEPHPWQNGNSHAEAHARHEARAVIGVIVPSAPGQESPNDCG